MAILNYTTSISADKSIGEIQKCLASHGANAILCHYDNSGNIISLSFKIIFEEQQMSFTLPSDWKPVLQVMNGDRKIPNRLKTNEQALRVSWRIIKDWVEAQMAFIETKMVTLPQVFLPYAQTKNGETVYESIAKNPEFLLLN